MVLAAAVIEDPGSRLLLRQGTFDAAQAVEAENGASLLQKGAF